MQIKTTMRYHLTSVRKAIIKKKKKKEKTRINASKDVEKRELMCTVGGIVNWYSQLGKEYRGSPHHHKLKIELPYDPAIPLLGIYPKETKTLSQRDTCTPIFIATLFTKMKTWKETKCPLKDEWIKKF